MIYYINVNKKRIVGRNNQIPTRPLNLEYDVTEVIDFQFIDDNNQIQALSQNTPGLTLAIGLKQNMPSYDLLALSHDYEIVNGQTLRFTVNTYTVNWLKKINKANTEVFIEISQQSLESKKVWMRDYCYVWPRVYTAGLEPEEIASNDYYTKAETDEAIENAIEGISGFVTEQQFEEGLATKQNVIDADNKLDYALLSGTPTIPTKTSDLENDSDFVTSSDVETAISGKADKSEIPTKTSDLDNDSGFITDSALVVYATESYVQGEVSGKQDKITNDNKLDYSLLSSTPTIPVVPTNVSDFTNDAGYQTAQDVQDAISGKADTSVLTAHTSDTTIHVTSADKTTWDGKQDAITNDNKLDYALLSGTPSIPLSTSELINDSDFQTSTDVANAISGKLDAPSGGTEGQVLTKTANGEEWADAQGGTIKVDDKVASGAFVVDFAGAQIQKYDVDSAVSGSLTIQYDNIDIPEGTAPTVELQVPVTGDVSTVNLPADTQVIEMPDTLTGGIYTYHDIVFRAQKDFNDAVKVYANYAYKFKEELDYFWIEAAVNNATVAYGNENASLEYSFDKVNWNNFDTTQTMTLQSVGDRIYFRGNNDVIGDGPKFSLPSSVNLGGNIMSLLDKTCQMKTMTSQTNLGAFRSLFSEQNIIHAHNLKLPATTLSNGCYEGMFSMCSNMVTAPKLPALTLTDDCYSWMFARSGITSLVLPATTLAQSCYGYICGECGNLSEIEVHFTDWTYLTNSNWLDYVSGTGTFKCPAELPIEYGSGRIPANWTVVNI